MTFIKCKSRSTAKRLEPQAKIFVKVEGGFMAFDYPETYKVWKGGRK